MGAVAVGAGRDADEAKLGDLAVERAAERLDDLAVAGAALRGDVETELVGVRTLDGVRGVAVGTHRRGIVAGLPRRRVHALVVTFQNARVARATRGRDVGPEHPRGAVIGATDVMRPVAIGARRRGRGQPRLLFRPGMNAVVIIRTFVIVTAGAGHRRELLRMREFLQGGEVLVAVDAGERAVLRVGERPGVDGDRRSVLPLAVGVAVAGHAVVVARRLDDLRLGTRCNREPQKEEGRK